MYKTGNGRAFSTFFTNDVCNALLELSQRTGESPSYVVRQALIEYLSAHGYPRFSNPRRGERSDLRRSSVAQKKRDIKEVINNDENINEGYRGATK